MIRTTQHKKAASTAGKSSQQLQDDKATRLSAGANIMQLQRTLGNHATMQMLKSQSVAIQRKANVIQREGSDDEADDDFVDDSGYDADTEASPKLTAEQKKALKRYPREVTREDAIIDKGIGEYGGGKGKPKAHRNPSRDLVPAGAGLKLDQSPVTALDHLKGTYPNKGASSRISFANGKKALALRDYTSATKPSASSAASVEQSPQAVTATLKARKLMRARMKGKTTATVETTNDLIRSVRAEGGKSKSASQAEGYAKRDAEVESIGHIDRRFLKYSDDVDNDSTSDWDSDSDSDCNDSSTDYSDLEDDI